MKRRTRGGLLVALGMLLVVSPVVSRADDEAKPIAGFEAAVVAPTNALRNFTNTGGQINPFVGFMFNDWIGIWGHVGVLGLPKQEVPPGALGSKQGVTWALSYYAGPRFQIPLSEDKVYIWATFEAGGETGFASHGAISDTSWGFSTGGGIDARVSDQITIGPFARWQRFYQRVHGVGDVRYVTAGMDMTWNEISPPPPPAPAPPPMAAAPPPPAPPMKKKIVLRGVNFDFNKADIRPDARPILDEAIRILKQEGDVSIVCAGYTDSIGSQEYNMKLSLRRANAVRNYLVAGGISPNRIEVEGFGKNDPVASNATADGRAQNRRVELRVK